MIKRILHALVLLAFLAGLLGFAPSAPAAARSGEGGIPPEALLNPDGTLKLDDSTRGALDLSDYSVQLDPKRGPVFTPLAAQNNWAAVGAGGGPFSNQINAIAVNGTDVYVGGWFENAADIPAADYVAHWDGTQWLAMGHNGAGNGAITGSVNSVLYAGGNLYVAGWFGTVYNTSGVTIGYASRLARWNGSNWEAVPGLTANLDGPASALAYDPLTHILYVGGSFQNVNGDATADYIFGIDLDPPGTLVTLGNNGAGDGSLNTAVNAIAVDSTGAVYAGGNFANVRNGLTTLNEADYIAKWSGLAWSALASSTPNVGALGAVVTTIAIDGSDNVYVGGGFVNANNIAAADYIVKWDGSWSSLGNSSVLVSTGGGVTVQKILTSGTDVYVGGYFTLMSLVPSADYLVRFDTTGSTWNGVGDDGAGDGSLNGAVLALAYSGGNLYVGGEFFDVNNGSVTLPVADYFAIHSSGSWSTLGSPNGPFTSSVNAMAVIGSDVYVGGYFYHPGGDPRQSFLTRWDGSTWQPVGNSGQMFSPLESYVFALAVDGTDLYVGGNFNTVYDDGVPISGSAYIAKWNGTTWSALGGGLNGIVRALAVDASHNLYAGGDFTDAAGITEADYIAKWDGAAWSSLGSGGAGVSALNGVVKALGVSGSNVYAGGTFTSVVDASNATIDYTAYLAKWNGASWSAMDGMTQALTNSVSVITVSGTDVYVGGGFGNLNGLDTADSIAKWNGSVWSGLGSNGSYGGSLGNIVNAIAVDGSDVYVGGSFTNVTNIDGSVLTTADYIAKWDGTNWSALGSDGASNGSLNGQVTALLLVGNDLLVGGYFKNISNGGVIIPEADYMAAFGKNLPPEVVSSLCTTTCATSQLSVDFTVTFSETVENVDTGDFSLITSGVIGASITGVTGTGATRTVSVSTGVGNGTLRLDIPNTATITDTTGNSLTGLPFTGGNTYTVTRKLVVRSQGANDGWVLESGATTNVGGTKDNTATTLRLGDETSRKQYRSILSFATGASLPDNAVITKVTLKVKKQGIVGGGNPVSLFQGFMVDIRKGTLGTAALQLTDWQTAASKTLGPFNTALSSGWYVINLTPGKGSVNKFATGNGLTQIRLRFNLQNDSNTVANYLVLYSGNHATTTYRPQLIVAYYVP